MLEGNAWHQVTALDRYFFKRAIEGVIHGLIGSGTIGLRASISTLPNHESVMSKQLAKFVHLADIMLDFLAGNERDEAEPADITLKVVVSYLSPGVKLEATVIITNAKALAERALSGDIPSSDEAETNVSALHSLCHSLEGSMPPVF